MVSICILLPFFASIIVACFGPALGKNGAQLITCIAGVISALLSIVILHEIISQNEVWEIKLFTWINSGSLSVSWGFYIDSLTAIMIFIVTTVSALVHIYSVGYMAKDPHIQRFMCYLSLFTFSMLILVTSNNFVQLFFGWEGVGLCSYLLIGFWYTKPSANVAAIKAFLINRVGDLGLVLGILALFLVFGSVEFSHIFEMAPDLVSHKMMFCGYSWHSITLICLLLFFGAMGKSAQIGLHTWLPDAMEGPTPVSALIHAATMVTAGVFLVARCSPLFELSSIALLVVTLIGGMTAFLGASIALVQTDIKRVIAYSTCSQLGYMFFACGLSAYSIAIFHLFTHAFFKALLFLGAGSLIHAMSGEQDMRKMGGVWHLIPTTYVIMIIGSWALIGLPPFSGFFSKDLILESAYGANNWQGGLVFCIGLVVVIMTAFYSAKIILMSFHGTLKSDEKVLAHIHESPKVMLLPLYGLALGAGGAGYLGLIMVDPHTSFWGEALSGVTVHGEGLHSNHPPLGVKVLPLLMAVMGLATAWCIYIKYPSIKTKLVNGFPAIRKFLLKRWYFDYAYDVVFLSGIKRVSMGLWKSIDVGVVDALGPEGIATFLFKSSRKASELQTGYIFHYAFAMVLGLMVFLTLYFFFQGTFPL